MILLTIARGVVDDSKVDSRAEHQRKPIPPVKDGGGSYRLYLEPKR